MWTKEDGITQHFSQHNVEFPTDIFLDHLSRRRESGVSLIADRASSYQHGCKVLFNVLVEFQWLVLRIQKELLAVTHNG